MPNLVDPADNPTYAQPLGYTPREASLHPLPFTLGHSNGSQFVNHSSVHTPIYEEIKHYHTLTPSQASLPYLLEARRHTSMEELVSYEASDETMQSCAVVMMQPFHSREAMDCHDGTLGRASISHVSIIVDNCKTLERTTLPCVNETMGCDAVLERTSLSHGGNRVDFDGTSADGSQEDCAVESDDIRADDRDSDSHQERVNAISQSSKMESTTPAELIQAGDSVSLLGARGSLSEPQEKDMDPSHVYAVLEPPLRCAASESDSPAEGDMQLYSHLHH